MAFDARYKDIASLSIPTVRRFADAHGYSLRTIERDDCTKPGGWIKIEQIIAALSDPFDFVLWMDADVYVTRTDLDIRNVIHPNVHLHMSWHTPTPTRDPDHFNTGVMLIRASGWSRKFFTSVWEYGAIPQHRWNDQATIHHLLGRDWIAGLGPDRVDEIAQSPVSSLNTTWNSIAGVCALSDPVVWHYAGMEKDRRLSAMHDRARLGQ